MLPEALTELIVGQLDQVIGRAHGKARNAATLQQPFRTRIEKANESGRHRGATPVIWRRQAKVGGDDRALTAGQRQFG